MKTYVCEQAYVWTGMCVNKCVCVNSYVCEQVCVWTGMCVNRYVCEQVYVWTGMNPVIHFYSKTSWMHNFRVYWISLYMFRTVFPSVIRSPRLYTQRQVYVRQVLWLLASKQFFGFIGYHSTCFGRSFRLSSEVLDCTHSVRCMSDTFCGCLLASSHRTCMTYTCRCIYSLGLLMTEGKTVRNMQSDIQ
jgi:hypothetical protein